MFVQWMTKWFIVASEHSTIVNPPNAEVNVSFKTTTQPFVCFSLWEIKEDEKDAVLH